MIAFGIGAALTLLLAFEGGGYDIVSRQQAAMVIWALIAAGFALDLLPRGRPSGLAQLAVVALGAFLALTIIALAWTESDERTVEEIARVAGYLGFVVLAYFGVSRYTATAAAAGLISAALVVPCFSVLARLLPATFNDEAVELFGVDRLSYPLGYWNALACWCGMAIAMGLTWSAHAKRVEIRGAALAALPVAGTAVYLTYSRAGAVAVGVALLAALAASRNRWTVALHAVVAAAATGLVIAVVRGQDQIARATGDEGAGAVAVALIAAAAVSAAAAILVSRTPLDRFRVSSTAARTGVAGAAAIVLVGALTVGRGPIDEAYDEFRNEGAPAGAAASADPSARLSSFGGIRDDTWSSAIDAFESDNARGVGPGSFEFWWAREGEAPDFLRDAHSLYLESLAELGVVGFLSIVSFLVLAAAAALQARAGITRGADLGAAASLIAGFAVFVVYAGVDWIWEIPALVLLGLGGIAVAGAASSERWGDQASLPMWARAGAIAVAGVLFAVQVPGLVSTERLRASAAELRDGSPEEALELADESINAQPYAASPYVQRALVEESTGDLDGARSDLLDAIDRESTNWRHRLLLARVEARAGNREQAELQLRRARKLSPNTIYLAPGASFQAEIEAILRP